MDRLAAAETMLKLIAEGEDIRRRSRTISNALSRLRQATRRNRSICAWGICPLNSVLMSELEISVPAFISRV